MQVVRIVCAAVIALAVAGCAIERAQVAGEAQQKMVGLSKEQVLACMGPPATKAACSLASCASTGTTNAQITHSRISFFMESPPGRQCSPAGKKGQRAVAIDDGQAYCSLNLSFIKRCRRGL